MKDTSLILNDRHEYWSIVSVCNACKHYNEETYTCSAFPTEIPDAILGGKRDHDVPTSNQNNSIVFEAI